MLRASVLGIIISCSTDISLEVLPLIINTTMTTTDIAIYLTEAMPYNSKASIVLGSP